MRSTYEVLELLIKWHITSRKIYWKEKHLLKLWWEACKGLGDSPSDIMIHEQAGISLKEMKWIHDIGWRFLIK